MTIGEQLKALRMAKGLTQKEMAAGIVSASYYSKVENDEQSIDQKRLNQILEMHHLNADVFRLRLIYSENITKLSKVRGTVERAASIPNREELDNLSKMIKDEKIELPIDVKYELMAAYAWDDGSNKNVSLQVRQRVKDFLDMESYAPNSYLVYAMLVILLDLDDGYAILKKMINQFNERSIYNPSINNLICYAVVSFLKCCCLKNQLNDKYASFPVKFLKDFPNGMEVSQQQLMGLYYESVWKKDTKTQKIIEDIFHQAKIPDKVYK